MNVEHEFPLDDILFSANAFRVLDNGLPCRAVGIDEIGNVTAGTFEENARVVSLEILATFAILGRYQLVGHLLPQVGDKPGTLHEAELGSAVVLFLGSMTAHTLVAVLIPTLESK